MKGLVLILVISAMCAGQEAKGPEFEVVSIRLDRAGTGGAGDDYPQHGTWHWTRIPLGFLIMYAYDIPLTQIDGVPSSFQSPDTAFDITAKVPPDVTHEQFRLMLQAMLTDRFHFTMHRQTRESTVNAIEIAKGGAKLKPAAGECFRGQRAAVQGADQHECGKVTQIPIVTPEKVSWEYIGWSVTVGDLARALSTGTPVIDDTGIQGLYDIDVKVQYVPMPAAADPGERLALQAENNSRVKAAFEKELGLTIDLGKTVKRPLPVILVDHVELPTPN